MSEEASTRYQRVIALAEERIAAAYERRREPSPEAMEAYAASVARAALNGNLSTAPAETPNADRIAEAHRLNQHHMAPDGARGDAIGPQIETALRAGLVTTAEARRLMGVDVGTAGADFSAGQLVMMDGNGRIVPANPNGEIPEPGIVLPSPSSTLRVLVEIDDFRARGRSHEQIIGMIRDAIAPRVFQRILRQAHVDQPREFGMLYRPHTAYEVECTEPVPRPAPQRATRRAPAILANTQAISQDAQTLRIHGVGFDPNPSGNRIVVGVRNVAVLAVEPRGIWADVALTPPSLPLGTLFATVINANGMSTSQQVATVVPPSSLLSGSPQAEPTRCQRTLPKTAIVDVTHRDLWMAKAVTESALIEFLSRRKGRPVARIISQQELPFHNSVAFTVEYADPDAPPEDGTPNIDRKRRIVMENPDGTND